MNNLGASCLDGGHGGFGIAKAIEDDIGARLSQHLRDADRCRY
ncbi:hypothetical protein [Cupriavidus taiwanensis]